MLCQIFIDYERDENNSQSKFSYKQNFTIKIFLIYVNCLLSAYYFPSAYPFPDG